MPDIIGSNCKIKRERGPPSGAMKALMWFR
jgi:hypothetical protein